MTELMKSSDRLMSAGATRAIGKYSLDQIPVVRLGNVLAKCIACTNLHLLELVSVPGDPQSDREHFRYVHCSICGTLKLWDHPTSTEVYYPDDYYSFVSQNTPGIRGWAKSVRDRVSIFGAGPLTPVLDWFSVNPGLAALRPLFDGTLGHAFGREHSYLDVGCGDGQHLWEMRRIGFRNLTGIDPFMRRPFVDPGIRLVRGNMDNIQESFDVIIAQHSLEHVADPERALEILRGLILTSGAAIIRIPLAGTWAWGKYGGEWAQLDPPRHCTLFTVDGFTALTNRVGWKIKRIVYDSWSFQFAGSLLRKAGIDIHKNPDAIAKYFSPQQIRQFSKMAIRLNRAEQGDQAAFTIVPV